MPFDQGGKAMTRELVVSRSKRLLLPSPAISHQKKAAHASPPTTDHCQPEWPAKPHEKVVPITRRGR
jgi:hypothetical protein